MKRIKKYLPFILIIFIALSFAIVCGIGATIFGWENFVKAFIESVNQPIPLIGISFGTALLFFVIAFSKTSLGKKSLETLKHGIDVAKEETEKATTTLKETKKAVEDYTKAKEEEIKTLTETYKSYVDGANQKLRAYRDFTVDIAKEIHNVNVEEKVNKFIEENKEEAFDDISQIVLDAKEEVRSEYQNSITDLQAQLDDIKKSIQENKELATTSLNDAVNEVIESVEETKEEVINGERENNSPDFKEVE